MYPELRVRVQVDDIKLHLRSMSFDLREKNGGLIRVVQEMQIIDHELSLTKRRQQRQKQVWSSKASLKAEASEFL